MLLLFHSLKTILLCHCIICYVMHFIAISECHDWTLAQFLHLFVGFYKDSALKIGFAIFRAKQLWNFSLSRKEQTKSKDMILKMCECLTTSFLFNLTEKGWCFFYVGTYAILNNSSEVEMRERLQSDVLYHRPPTFFFIIRFFFQGEK